MIIKDLQVSISNLISAHKSRSNNHLSSHMYALSFVVVVAAVNKCERTNFILVPEQTAAVLSKSIGVVVIRSCHMLEMRHTCSTDLDRCRKVVAHHCCMAQ